MRNVFAASGGRKEEDMIIDFHTHIFPEKIVKGTIAHLEQVSGIKAFSNGLYEGLKSSMKEAGVDISVVLPVVTKPSQFETINRYAAEINGKDGIISFGGIHPEAADYKKELETIKSLGLKGIKLHPDYQKTFIDEECYVRIIRYAIELGLFVSIHSGVDVGLPDPVHCMPDRASRMLDAVGAEDFEKPYIILAHTGGYQCWDEVEQYIAGRNVCLDISFSLGRIPDKQLYRIARNHGIEKILFATDSPWSGQKQDLEYFKKMDFNKREKERILGGNGKALLGL